MASITQWSCLVTRTNASAEPEAELEPASPMPSLALPASHQGSKARPPIEIRRGRSEERLGCRQARKEKPTCRPGLKGEVLPARIEVFGSNASDLKAQ